MSFLRKILEFFFPSTSKTIEETEVEVAAVEATAIVSEVKSEVKRVPKSPAKAEVAAKRTRKADKFVGDDKSTPDVNEAFKDGKSPTKKTTKKKPALKVEK